MFTKTTSNYKHAKAGDGQPQVFTWATSKPMSALEVMVEDQADSSYTVLPGRSGDGSIIAEYSNYYGMWIIWHD